MINKKYIKPAVIVVLMLTAGLIYFISSSQNGLNDPVRLSDTGGSNQLLSETGGDGNFIMGETKESHISGELLTQPSAEVTRAEETKGLIWIHVCGEVNAGGVYPLPSGSRICDAIEAAGGLTSEAAADYLNLAQLLTDGQRIAIPSALEAETMTFYGTVPEQSAAVMNHNDSETSVSLININTADKNALMTLPGIGEAKAEAIMAYRNDYGRFSSIEDIMNVTGIKQGAFDKIKAYITVS